MSKRWGPSQEKRLRLQRKEQKLKVDLLDETGRLDKDIRTSRKKRGAQQDAERN